VIARDDAEEDGALELDDGLADLGAVLQLPLSQRLGRAVEPDRFARR